MNKIVSSVVTKKLGDKANEIVKLADEEIVISKKVFGLEIAVALLGGIVLGMFLSPRKNCSYKIASGNNINSEEDDYDDYYDDDDDDNGKKSKFIKL